MRQLGPSLEQVVLMDSSVRTGGPIDMSRLHRRRAKFPAVWVSSKHGRRTALQPKAVPPPTKSYQSAVKRVCLTHYRSVLMMKQSISSYFSKNPSTSKDTSAEGTTADADSDQEKEQASERPTPVIKILNSVQNGCKNFHG
ncbi:hypothetical protein DPX16_19369 [Anabarilius grahami]|uniref:Uncharacterized protein n=1 Tax=Anabarilius grahami TaxID=495550 RepID=A0A3N0Z067_ANAGA|nr:hypothetical protein DPX16_19369 [Anabarilius grahami]